MIDKVDASCLPQMRMTAQPIVHARDNPTSFFPPREPRGPEDVVEEGSMPMVTDHSPDALTAADYALYLSFNLDEASSMKLAGALLEFNKACKGITEGLPFGPLECLRRDLAGAKVHPDAYGALRALISTYAKTHSFAAVMGTDLNQDPWVFYKGQIK